MITCVIDYTIDPAKIDAYEQFARRWIELVNQHGGTHHGYYLPAEGAESGCVLRHERTFMRPLITDNAW